MKNDNEAAAPPPIEKALRLSDDLRQILEQAAGKPITLGEIIEILHGRELDVLIIILSLPFSTPIPLPGLSTPFGLILMFFGFRIVLRKGSWLPRRLLDRKIPYPALLKIINGASAVAGRLEKALRPRLRFFQQQSICVFLNGMTIISSAFILMLPLPIPFTNALPAWSILLVAAGMTEEDGAAIIAGYLLAALSWLYLFLLIWLGKAGLGWFGF